VAFLPLDPTDASHTPWLFRFQRGERIAVVDLGTNVFGLVVGTLGPDGIPHWHHRADIEVGLAMDGFGILAQETQHRAESALQKHTQEAISMGATALFGFGTSALRQWNGADAWLNQNSDRLSQVEFHGKRIPCQLQTLSGELEADTIRYGLEASGLLNDGPVLINDIGGGSIELVVCEGATVYHSVSLPLGMRRLLREFPISREPISREPISLHEGPNNPYKQAFDACYDFLRNRFQNELREVLLKYPPKYLLGTAGPYLTLERWVQAYQPQAGRPSGLGLDRELCRAFGAAATQTLLEEHPPMHPLATDAIVHASALILALSDTAQGLPIRVTDLSLREGALLRFFGPS